MPQITTVTGVVAGSASAPRVNLAAVSTELDSYSTSAVVSSVVKGSASSSAVKSRKAGNGVQPIFGQPNGSTGHSAPVCFYTAIIPGPIANSNLGYQIGYSAFLRNVPRVYPPIFINPRPAT